MRLLSKRRYVSLKRLKFHFGWRVGCLRKTWLLGVEQNFAIDGWSVHFIFFTVQVWREH